jgi:hypothetical protein
MSLDESYEVWREHHRREVEAQECATQERVNRIKTDLDLQFTMINASAQLCQDELLAGKSEEYRRGFLDGQIFEREWNHEIFTTGS